MAELQKIPTPEKKDKTSGFQAKHNIRAKSIAHMLGTNMALFICLLLPVFLIGTVWTDFGTPEFGIKFLSEGIVTVALFIVGESLMMRVGADGGKIDAEYVSAKDEFLALVDKVHSIGTMLMSVFCEWQTDVEFRQAKEVRFRALRMTQEEIDSLKGHTYGWIIKKLGTEKFRKLVEYERLQPIELSEQAILYDDTSDLSRGGVPIGGEKYLVKKMLSPRMILSCIFTGLVTVSVVMTITTDASFSRVMYTIFKLIILLFRMALGYNTGAKAYNTIEVRQLKVKSNYLRQYVKFIEDKTYLNLGDKYGDIQCFLNDNTR